MTEIVTLDFQNWPRFNAIRETSNLTNGIRERILPLFTEAADKYESYRDREIERLWEDRADGDAPTEEEIGEALSIIDYDEPHVEAEELANHLLQLSLAGLYHLWERRLKQTLVEALARHDLGDWRDVVHGADFPQIRKWFVSLGFPCASMTAFDALDPLRLIANIVKHGDGKSCEELAKKDLGFFVQSKQKANFVASADGLIVRPEHLDVFARDIIKFWEQFPLHAQLTVKTVREPELTRRR